MIKLFYFDDIKHHIIRLILFLSSLLVYVKKGLKAHRMSYAIKNIYLCSMMRFSVIIALVLSTTTLFSQNIEAIKDLLSKLDETKGKEKVELLIEISSNYGYQSFNLSEKYARQAEQLSLELNYDTALIRIYRILGASKQYQDLLDSAIYYFTKSIDFSKKINDEKEIARSSSNLGVVYASDGEYEKAKEIFLSSLEILEKLKDTVSCQQLYNNLGTIYHLQKDYDKSIEYYNKALNHLDSNSVDFGIRISNLAENYFYKGNTNLALDFYNNSIRIFETKDSKYNIAYTYLRIAKLYNELNEKEKAKMYGLQAINVAKTVNAQEVLVKSYKLLVDIERFNKNYESAFRYNDQYLSIKDSLNTSKKNKLLNELKIQYNVDLMDIELRRKNVEIKSKSHILYSLGAGVLLAVILIVILIIQIRKINAAYKDLARQNMNFVSAEEELSELKEEIFIKSTIYFLRNIGFVCS